MKHHFPKQLKGTQSPRGILSGLSNASFQKARWRRRGERSPAQSVCPFLTCHSDQCAENFNQRQHEGDPKVAGEGEEEGVAIGADRVLQRTGRDSTGFQQSVSSRTRASVPNAAKQSQSVLIPQKTVKSKSSTSTQCRAQTNYRAAGSAGPPPVACERAVPGGLTESSVGAGPGGRREVPEVGREYWNFTWAQNAMAGPSPRVQASPRKM